MPNSYYAKTAFGLAQLQTGGSYTASSLKNYGFLIPLLIVGLNGTRYLPLGAILAGYAAYITLVGGDWMEGFRFYVPMMPLMAVIAAEGAQVLVKLGQTQSGSMRRVIGTSVGIAVVLAWSFNFPSPTGRPGGLRGYYDGGFEGFGRWLAENAPPQATLATGFAGIVPCLSGLRPIDMMGLNDRYIAHLGKGLHRNYDSRYVLGQEPDYIMLVSTTDLRTKGFTGWIGEVDLFQNPNFQKNYIPALVFFSPSKGAYLWLFQRKLTAVPLAK